MACGRNSERCHKLCRTSTWNRKSFKGCLRKVENTIGKSRREISRNSPLVPKISSLDARFTQRLDQVLPKRKGTEPDMTMRERLRTVLEKRQPHCVEISCTGNHSSSSSRR